MVWGRSAATAPMATEPSKPATVVRNASSRSAPSANRRDTRVGITLASVVISEAMRQRGRGFQVGEVVDVAVQGGDDEGSGGLGRSSDE